MLKIQAFDLLGGSARAAANEMGVSYQAVNKWPDQLPDRIADRVLGVCVRRGIPVPAEFIDGADGCATFSAIGFKPNTPETPASNAQAAIKSVAHGV